MKPTSSFKQRTVSSAAIAHAASVINQGGVVAFPTETYYGLAVDAFNEEALTRLFQVKKRTRDKPILSLVGEVGQLAMLVRDVPALFQPLISKFWPGPLTLVFDGLPSLSSLLTSNTGTVGARISSHPVAQQLVKAVNKPITATSANLSGRPAAVNRKEVESQLGRLVDLVLDGGDTPGGKGSTIIGYKKNHLILIREGVIPGRRIFNFVEGNNL